MNALRKGIGLFILFFIALPVLFGIIWAVGLTRAFVSPEVIAELPKNIVQSMPQIFNDTLALAERDDADISPETRIWLKAAKQTGVPIKEVMEKSGLFAWVERDFAGTLNKVSEALQGRRDPEHVMLDFRPLKNALAHEAVEQYFNAVLEKLPACDAAATERWQQAIRWGGDVKWEHMPPCRPDAESAKAMIALTRERIHREIPDEVALFDDMEHFPRHLNISALTVSFAYLLFLIPAGFILIGALVASRNRREFFAWAGIFILLGGLLTLGTVYLTHHFSDWAFSGFPANFWHHFSWAEDYMTHRLGSHIQQWVKPIIAPVKEVAEIVSIVGLLIFAFSFLLASDRRRLSSVPPPPAAPPAQS